MYTTRFYRKWTRTSPLRRFRATDGSSDLEIAAGCDCTETACRLLRRARGAVEDRIGRDPHFGTSLAPLPVSGREPEPVASMLRAGREWDVGPMAAVAGSIAGFVGRGLSGRGPVVVENGGDIYARGPGKLVVRLYAGEESPFGRVVEFCVDASGGVGVCTSSGRVGPSLSLGRADAVTVVAHNPATADAAATALANRVAFSADVEGAVEAAVSAPSVRGAMACCGGRMAVWGLRLLAPEGGGC